MAYREFYYRWQWQLQASPEQLWPLVADTNRFDRDVGLPTYEDIPQSADGLHNGRRRLRIRIYGVPLDWVEEPFEWVRPYRFGVVRNYEPGLLQPLKQLRVLAQLQPQPNGGTHLIYEVWAAPHSIIGLLTIPIQIGQFFRRSFAKAFQEYDQLAARQQDFTNLPGHPPKFPPGGQRRLQNLQDSLTAAGVSPQLLQKLVQVIKEADDLTLQRLRPYQLADYWQASRRDALEMSLLATRQGLLDFQWDLLCPMCRVAKQSVSHLADINQEVHCDTCHIDYRANFTQSVELTFKPNKSVRELDDLVAYCTAGPQAMPHVALQQALPAHSSREVTPQLELGRYRLRTMTLPGAQAIRVTAVGDTTPTFRAQAKGWLDDEQQIAPAPTITLQNESDSEQLFILERVAWADDAVTAAEVTLLQQFRDLFSEEALRPGDQISVGNLAILFTDLCDSTRMYREIGDAPAFGLVMDHFDVLRRTIMAEDGVMVKTIGDAVMAVFRRPVSAIRAILQAQESLLNPPAGQRPLALKASIHFGPCIGVTLNDRLDYFGSTVNIAARLEKFSQGGDMVLSDAVYSDPEVQDLLADRLAEQLESLETTLKGFDEDCFLLWRLKLNDERTVERKLIGN